MTGPARALFQFTLLATAAGCQGPPTPPGNGIVFCSDRAGGVFKLHRMDSDGGNVRLMLPGIDGEHRNPRVCGRSGLVVFESIRGGRSDLFVWPLDGSHPLRRITDSGLDDQPDWSPDGTRIAFRSRRDGASAVFVCASDGSNVERLSPRDARDRWPRWSPDGRRIAFSRIAADEDIWVMDADGDNRAPLFRTPAADSRPTWSPDGSSVAFHSTSFRSRKHRAILSVSVGGGEPRVLHGGDAALREQFMDRNTASWGPVFAPDGRAILFVSTRTGNAEIYRMDADGGNVRRLTNDPAQDAMPSWLPAASGGR